MPSRTFIIETFPPNTNTDLGIWFLTLLITLKAEEVTCYEESHFLYEDTSTHFSQSLTSFQQSTDLCLNFKPVPATPSCGTEVCLDHIWCGKRLIVACRYNVTCSLQYWPIPAKDTILSKSVNLWAMVAKPFETTSYSYITYFHDRVPSIFCLFEQIERQIKLKYRLKKWISNKKAIKTFTGRNSKVAW